MRKTSTTANGREFNSAVKDLVWQLGTAVAGYDPNKYRKDACGTWMTYADYGNANSLSGWEIDHIIPIAHGGSDHLWNLQPLHWENNRRKGDGPNNLSCRVTASQSLSMR